MLDCGLLLLLLLVVCLFCYCCWVVRGSFSFSQLAIRVFYAPNAAQCYWIPHVAPATWLPHPHWRHSRRWVLQDRRRIYIYINTVYRDGKPLFIYLSFRHAFYRDGTHLSQSIEMEVLPLSFLHIKILYAVYRNGKPLSIYRYFRHIIMYAFYMLEMDSSLTIQRWESSHSQSIEMGLSLFQTYIDICGL